MILKCFCFFVETRSLIREKGKESKRSDFDHDDKFEYEEKTTKIVTDYLKNSL